MSDSLYHELILDLYRHPLNKGKPLNFTTSKKGSNPSCGDTVEVFIEWTGEQVSAVGWEGKGCAISEASASLLTDFVKNKTKTQIKEINSATALKLLGLTELNPTRLRCALLALQAIVEQT